ncbi:MAG: FAD-dependent oxidoreductase, partial [Desulfobacterales bacterium]|nr:FAD-dependent oxidoreductase [Desulfobacterales bacterium]
FAGTGYSGYRMSPRWWNPDGVQVYLAEGVRKAVRAAGYDIPIVSAGKIRTPELAEEILTQGRADVIGMARALLCDPDWPLKAREGRSGEIVKCAACGFCSEADERYEKVTCIHWPKGAVNPPSPWLLAPPCSAACPAGINIRDYVDLITQGKFAEALDVIREKCPFPGVVSRICPAFCEKKCNRAGFDEAIAINPLKRFLVDRVGLEQKGLTPVPRMRKDRVAIVGSGPAGLSAGYYLVRMGYGVTVFEALPVPGGMMSVGIQESRLPRDLVNVEIENIRKAGVEIKTNNPVGGKGISLEELRRQGFKAIFLAVGTRRKRELKLPGGEKVGSAFGEIPDFSFLEGSPLKTSSKKMIETDPHSLMTNIKGVFAGGDMIHGPTSVIQAVGSGRRAAFSIHQYLSGESLETSKTEPSTLGIDAMNVGMFKKRGRQKTPRAGAYDEDAALSEADRCFQCGMFPKK